MWSLEWTSTSSRPPTTPRATRPTRWASRSPRPQAPRRRWLPDGLCADGIPLESRIILAADAFEAMTSDRPYRRAPGQEFAIAELRRHAGTQFDPAVVAALCRVCPTAPGTAGPPNRRPPDLPAIGAVGPQRG
jgi:HD domain-containing protein